MQTNPGVEETRLIKMEGLNQDKQPSLHFYIIMFTITQIPILVLDKGEDIYTMKNDDLQALCW